MSRRFDPTGRCRRAPEWIFWLVAGMILGGSAVAGGFVVAMAVLMRGEA